MRTTSLFFALALLFLLGSYTASAQVSVRIGGGYCPAPRVYYGPRYYPPRPAVGYAVPPVLVVPGPYYAPRPAYYAPRPYYGHGGRGRYGRRW